MRENTFLLDVDGKSRAGNVLDLETMKVVHGLFWAAPTIHTSSGTLKLAGLPKPKARRLETYLRDRIERERTGREVDAIAPALQTWARSIAAAVRAEQRRRGWLSKEFIRDLEATRPAGISEALSRQVRARIHDDADEAVLGPLRTWDEDLAESADVANHQHLSSERTACAEFFSRVEKSPLTAEQVEAVVCFDSRVLLVAAAGSGKTSTMVAKAGYALHRGYFAPESILLLAFNNAAAAELRERIQARLGPLGLSPEKVTAKTFHAFGLDIIGRATGKRPSIAPWLESSRDLEKLEELVDRLKDASPAFRTSWDLFRVVFAQDLPAFGKEAEDGDSWDRANNRPTFWTLGGENVKSRGELLIANWLFYNGVAYEYERRYEHETADATHRQYTPDFYLTEAGVYLEHWALDANGQPPPSFHGYLEGVHWKRSIHKSYGTKLLETTMAQLWSGQAFVYLEEQLRALGVTVDPNPDRVPRGRKPIENARLARTFRTFMVHAKSNRLNFDDLRSRLDARAPGPFAFRHRTFLNLYEQLAAAWEAELRQSGNIDFDDMLVMAADLVEQGRWNSPYELVMVDEFQDASQARVRLLQGLARRPRTCVFAVGDDWQSINRFAGSDLSAMTDFEKSFGPSVTLKLEQTFRCAPTLCAISSTFVQKNPSQIKKSVRSGQADVAEPVSVIRLDEPRLQGRSAVARRILELQSGSSDSRPSFLVLGRYRHNRDHFPTGFDPDEVKLMTVHSSKGLEADHVIVLGMTSETMGFPSRIEDDPILQLALPAPEPYAYAEERRLFYVALTRARKTVTLITQAGEESAFVVELIKDFNVPTTDYSGEAQAIDVCPECGTGSLVPKFGRYGPYVQCSTAPRCQYRKSRRTAGQAAR